MGDILLIAPDWQLRALVRAQLLEEGYSVTAVPSLQMALAHLIRSGHKPRLTIVDTKGLSLAASALADLWLLTGRAPLVLCGENWRQADLMPEVLPPVQTLLRPFCVGDVVEQVRRMLPCPEGNTAG